MAATFLASHCAFLGLLLGLLAVAAQQNLAGRVAQKSQGRVEEVVLSLGRALPCAW
jgi:hypothetical protein